MIKLLKKIYHTFGKWSAAFPVFGFFYVHFMNSVDAVVTFFYTKKDFNSVFHINCSNAPATDPAMLDLVTIAYNNEAVIEWQIKFIKKNLKDKYTYTVADNSSSAETAQKIKTICLNNNVGYIRLPKNPYNGKLPSWSHGLALNWLYKHFIKPRQAGYFGFLDHDIFPVEPVEIIKILKQFLIYGEVDYRADKWYLWPGFCFFRREFFAGKRVNFSAYGLVTFSSLTGLDTGGGNWNSVYSKTPKDQVRAAEHQFAFLRQIGEPNPDGKPYHWVGDNDTLEANYDTSNLGENDRFIEFIDGWLHIRRMGYSTSQEARLKLNFLLTFFD